MKLVLWILWLMLPSVVVRWVLDRAVDKRIKEIREIESDLDKQIQEIAEEKTKAEGTQLIAQALDEKAPESPYLVETKLDFFKRIFKPAIKGRRKNPADRMCQLFRLKSQMWTYDHQRNQAAFRKLKEGLEVIIQGLEETKSWSVRKRLATFQNELKQ